MAADTSDRRRLLVFRTLDDAVRDAEMLLERGYDCAGNWTLSQCCSHLVEWMRFPVEGFPSQPVPVRAIFWTLRKTIGKRKLQQILVRQSMPAGTPTLRETVAASSGDDAEGVARFRRAVDRFTTHAGPLHPSPLFGDLDRETATKLQLVHCAHHLSFLLPRQT